MLLVKIVFWIFAVMLAFVAFGDITFTITDWDSHDHIWLRLSAIILLSLFVANLFGWIG